MSFSGLPAAAGLRAHVELARISDYIVSNVYDVAREEPLMTTLCIQKSLRLLSSWCEKLPAAVQGTEENFNGDRAVIELHMAHNQVRALRSLALFSLTFPAYYTRCAAFALPKRKDSHRGYAFECSNNRPSHFAQG